MAISIDLHTKGTLRCEAFNPSNNMSLTLRTANKETVSLYGLAPLIAWQMFDMFRDSETAFYYAAESVLEIGAKPVETERLIERARAVTCSALALKLEGAA